MPVVNSEREMTMCKVFVCDNELDKLQSEYDRLVAYRGRVIKYHDDCPDGDIRKSAAEVKLRELGARIVECEKKFDKFFSS